MPAVPADKPGFKPVEPPAKQFRTKELPRTALIALREIETNANTRAEEVIRSAMEDLGISEDKNNPWRYEPQQRVFRQEVLPEELSKK